MSRTGRALAAAAVFLAVAVLTTWPLAAGLTKDLPWELGDPLLTVWILGWDGSVFRHALTTPSALAGFWDANIFHPEPRSLAYSEHLVPQALQAFPVLALTGNVILAYNLVFLSTFVLSALGVYLLVRELTGSAGAGLVAGLVYGFSPYRVEQSAHLQVVSSQWMAFVLLGVHRFLDTRRAPWLVAASVALVAQNLSCAYFLLFFPPFAAAWALWEMARRRQLGDVRLWLALAAAASLVAAATAPFLVPYARVRASGGIVRPGWELERFSADVYSYLTASEGLRLWGPRLRVFPTFEGALFPGAVPLLLATLAVGAGVVRAWRSSRAPGTAEDPGARRWKRVVVVVAAVAAAASLGVSLVILGGGGEALSSLPGFRARSLGRPLWIASVSLGIVLALSPRWRRFAGAVRRAPFAFWLLAALLAALLSLGPVVRALGEDVFRAGPYRLLYEHVPGFDGLRVPARFAMLVTLFLAVLSGLGVAEILGRARRGGLLVAAAAVLFLLEANPAPIPLNEVWGDPAYKKLPPRVVVGAGAPAIYRALAALPPGRVIVHLPFGSGPWELRYMFYSLFHGQRLVNGMSGASPPAYARNAAELADPLRQPERAWRAILASGATHVVVHEGAWRRHRGPAVSQRLEARGARRVLSRDDDVLFEVVRPSGSPAVPAPGASP